MARVPAMSFSRYAHRALRLAASLTIVALLCGALPAVAPAEQLSTQVEAARPIIGAKAYTTHETLPADRYPFYTSGTGWTMVKPWKWISGFLPGTLWYEYQRTGLAAYRSAAIARQEPLEFNKDVTTNHDIGFILLNSYRNGYRLTGSDDYRDVLVQGAQSLATRYDEQIGMVRTANTDEDFWVYNDTMMNIELLFLGSSNGGDPAWHSMAHSHALRTVDDFIRPDGSTWHYVAYDEDSGVVVGKGQGQGYEDDSTWSRGHAWTIYGLAMAYRETGDPRLLDGAHRTSDYWRSNVPTDLVPFWDFDAPDIPAEPRDSSAAAIAAAAFIELGRLDPDPARRVEYLEMARDTLESLASPAYLRSDPAFAAALDHGTYAYMLGMADHGLPWGDYYMAEAIARLRTEVVRYAGPSRYTTAVRTSQLTFEAADTVVLANGLTYADAMSASSLAGLEDAPILLTPRDKLPSSVVREIERLGATRALIVGGSAAVSDDVENSLDSIPGVSVTRFGGRDRYEVSAAVASHVIQARGSLSGGRVFVVSGETFADALCASPMAFAHETPVLLTRRDALPGPVANVLTSAEVTQAVLVGGTASITDGVENEVRGVDGVWVERVAGRDRYATSAEFATWARAQGLAAGDLVGVATGQDYPDALTGGVCVGRGDGLLLLTRRSLLSASAEAYLRSYSEQDTQVRMFGGEAAISSYVETLVRKSLPEQ